jgi:transcriptional regulator with XRE-family HTH domain
MSATRQPRLSDTGAAGKDPLLTALGQRIASLRKGRRWERAHLARRLGVPPRRLAFWERGDNQPPLAMLLALGRVLEVSIEELAGVEPLKTNDPSGAIPARDS